MMRKFTQEEMLKRLTAFYGHPFTMSDFREYYEAFLKGGDCEDIELAADVRSYYPDLCGNKFNEKEWEEFVSDSFQNLYDMDILVPNFPRD